MNKSKPPAGRLSGVDNVHAHRFRHTFATWDARELDVQHLFGHKSLEMVRRYSASYQSEQSANRHVTFSPGDQMIARFPSRS
ncbi:MAG: tyrosine-type recombinase/integrase [Pirellulales bacterium]